MKPEIIPYSTATTTTTTSEKAKKRKSEKANFKKVSFLKFARKTIFIK